MFGIPESLGRSYSETFYIISDDDNEIENDGRVLSADELIHRLTNRENIFDRTIENRMYSPEAVALLCTIMVCASWNDKSGAVYSFLTGEIKSDKSTAFQYDTLVSSSISDKRHLNNYNTQTYDKNEIISNFMEISRVKSVFLKSSVFKKLSGIAECLNVNGLWMFYEIIPRGPPVRYVNRDNVSVDKVEKRYTYLIGYLSDKNCNQPVQKKVYINSFIPVTDQRMFL